MSLWLLTVYYHNACTHCCETNPEGMRFLVLLTGIMAVGYLCYFIMRCAPDK
jgi:hypothetical protein